jgi:hypothetical protein
LFLSRLKAIQKSLAAKRLRDRALQVLLKTDEMTSTSEELAREARVQASNARLDELRDPNPT